MQMEKKVKMIDLPLARMCEWKLHESNDFLQNSIEESAFWTLQDIYDQKAEQTVSDNFKQLVDLVSLDPLTAQKRPNLQNELSNVLGKLRDRQTKEKNEIKA